MTKTPPERSLDAADLLYGVKAIASFLGLTKRQAQHRIDAGDLPTFKMGGSICARRSTLRDHLAQLERAAREAEHD